MMRRRGLPLLLAAVALSALVFLALGSWQVQRMGWKKDLIARVQARVQAPPVAPPEASTWPALVAAPQDFEYRRLRLQGEFLHQDEALVQASTVLGPGFWVLTPLRLADGTLIFVNRGFVPPERRDPAKRGAAAPSGTVNLNGLLRISEPHGGFLRENDPAANRWHSRDVTAMAAARGLPANRVAPYFVDAEAEAAPTPGQWPIAGLTVVRFPDSHLVYVITWYVLALMAVGAGWFVLRSARRAPE